MKEGCWGKLLFMKFQLKNFGNTALRAERRNILINKWQEYITKYR